MHKAITAFVLGLVGGGGGAYAFLSSGAAASTAAEPAAAGPTEPAPAAGLRPMALALAAPGASPASPAGNAVFAFDLGDWATLDGVKDHKEENVKHLWRTIGWGYAQAGRIGDLLRLADAEIAGDTTNSIGVLWLIVYLPEGQRLSALEALLAAHPGLETLKGHLGRLYLLCGAQEKAFGLLSDAARETKGEDWDVVLALAGADPERADASLWALAAEGAWPAGIVGRVGNAFEQQGRGDLAKRWRELAASRGDPAPSPAEVAAAAARAVREAEAATREKPADGDAWETLAQARAKAGDKKGAFEAYARALDACGLDASILEAMDEIDPAAALPYVERAAKDDGGADVQRLLVRAYVENGRGHEAAEAFFRIRIEDIDGDEWLVGGIATLAPESALPDLERRLRRRGQAENAALLEAYGGALLASGQASRAFDAYKRALDAGASVQEGLARADPARAVPVLEQLRRDDPESSAWASALADAYRRLGRTDDAAAVCEKRLVDHPDETVPALRVLASIDPDKGLARLRAACERNPEDGSAWIALGDACRDLGRRPDARDAYQKARAADDSATARVRLASVR